MTKPKGQVIDLMSALKASLAQYDVDPDAKPVAAKLDGEDVELSFDFQPADDVEIEIEVGPRLDTGGYDSQLITDAWTVFVEQLSKGVTPANAFRGVVRGAIDSAVMPYRRRLEAAEDIADKELKRISK